MKQASLEHAPCARSKSRGFGVTSGHIRHYRCHSRVQFFGILQLFVVTDVVMVDSERKASSYKTVALPESQLDIAGLPYSVSVLKVGYCVSQADGTLRADGTISLITGPKNILVDTGGPWDRDFLRGRLREKGLEPEDINVVVGTHGHSDHIGNLNLFSAALTVVGYDVSVKDTYRSNKLAEGQDYCIDEHVSVVPTPGHTGQDVSVRVKGTSMGTVLLAGDLFESCSDDDTWRDLSMNPAIQAINRLQALCTANVIIPGHGLPFEVLRD
ncbi:metallo-beta-lactamase domain-containing protein 1 [Thalassophryne amazonica]|uniref:metallo-beta-lactamase domain-containing protein 1 n=1 Tax=Thalassophryne amazonica TaxID=390379 RepID=UPI00147156B3|nr:metallo-beta-lactamase domain-containing protein 1 [Thalassophryne amazonica]